MTARHVVEGARSVNLEESEYRLRKIDIRRIIYPSDARIDLAILETDYSPQLEEGTAGHIQIGGHLDDWVGDEFTMTKVLLLGYPTIPQSRLPSLVATEAEVNCVVDKYTGPHPHFIISSVPRGGFSGGPVISEYGFLLGILTESLVADAQETEQGYAAAISVEPLLVLLEESGIETGENTRVMKRLFDPGRPDGYG